MSRIVFVLFCLVGLSGCLSGGLGFNPGYGQILLVSGDFCGTSSTTPLAWPPEDFAQHRTFQHIQFKNLTQDANLTRFIPKIWITHDLLGPGELFIRLDKDTFSHPVHEIRRCADAAGNAYTVINYSAEVRSEGHSGSYNELRSLVFAESKNENYEQKTFTVLHRDSGDRRFASFPTTAENRFRAPIPLRSSPIAVVIPWMTRAGGSLVDLFSTVDLNASTEIIFSVGMHHSIQIH